MTLCVLFGNLIENAFGAFEQVEIEDKRIDISIEQTATVCAILVEDNGAGIDEAYLPRLYEKGFTRNKSEGTGYGLFLVKQIIEKGRGQIDVSSLQGEGTINDDHLPNGSGGKGRWKIKKKLGYC